MQPNQPIQSYPQEAAWPPAPPQPMTTETIEEQYPQQGVTHPGLQAQPAPAVDATGDYEDYWGFDETHAFLMPDGKQELFFKVLTEGDINRYNSILKRDVVVEKATGDARFKFNQSEERRALLLVAVTGWTLRKRNQRSGVWEVAKFNNANGGELDQWIQKANPALINDIEKAIRDKNPYLLQGGEDTVEAIDKQIGELQKQRDEIVARERGEGSSATR